MVSLAKIESDLITALKAKNQLVANTLRGLKVRIQNEQISKIKELTEEEIVVLVKSEIKRRREAADSFSSGGRPEQAEKELEELKILEQYLPPQISEQDLQNIINEMVIKENFTSADFGKAMGLLKARLAQQADGAMIAKLLKETLK